MTAKLPELCNIQANILYGTDRWKHTQYVFLRIDKPAQAGAAIDAFAASPHFATAASQRDGRSAANVNIAFTHAGLELMGATLDDTKRFEGRHTLRPRREPNEVGTGTPVSAFEAGMNHAGIDRWPEVDGNEYRWPEDNAVAQAWWSDDPDKRWEPEHEWPHLLVWISADSSTTRSEVYGEVDGIVRSSSGVREIGSQLGDALKHDMEHFGFVDGISQPAIEGIRLGKPGDGKLGARGWEGLKVGEFILGYEDEAHAKVDDSTFNEIAKDGTFLVYRKLRQDVQAFRDATSALAKNRTDTDPDAVAAALMGRRYDGQPLLKPPGAPDGETKKNLRNDFTYAGDRRGDMCPLGSHVRRVNPRDALHFEGRRVNAHRIIRRGMPYGPPYDQDQSAERGLIFIAINARIEDQFEFIQQHWLNRGTAFRIGDDADPIAGVGSDIRIVINGDKPLLHKVDRPFTQFRGGEYFFVPSISALKKITSR